VNLPPLNHIFYIPCALGVGFFIGWTIAQRIVRGEWARAEKRRRAKEEE
jgi:hypothetical protein